MYNIDLLKGQGLPARANFWLVAATGAAFAVLGLAAILATGSYLYNRIASAAGEYAISDYESGCKELEASLKEREVLVAQKKDMDSRFDELAYAVDLQTQWSEFLYLVSRHLPKDLIVDRLEVEMSQKRMTVVKRADPKQKTTINVPVRSVVISLHCEQGCDGDQAVRDFQRRLMESESFGKCVSNVVITARTPAQIDNRDVTTYKLDCLFKTKLL